MSVVETKLFPTPQNYQQNGDYTSPLKVSDLIQFLQAQQLKVPEGTQRDSIRIHNWGAMELWFHKETTPLEDAYAALGAIKDALQATGDRGVTADQVEHILKLIKL